MNLIIFDIDGTLIKKDKNFEIINWNLSFKYSFDIKNISTDCYISDIDSEILRRVFVKYKNRPPHLDEIVEFRKNLEQIYIDHINYEPSLFTEIEGASLAFSWLLNQENYEIRIATGNWENIASLKLKTAKIILQENIYGVYAEDAYSRKELLKAAWLKKPSQHNVNYKNVLYIGDTYKDYLSAKDLCFDFLGIAGNIENEKFLKNLGLKSVLLNYKNFPQYLNTFFI